MTDDHLGRLEALLAETLERTPAERSRFIAEACGDDHELRWDLEHLLELHEDASDYFDSLSGDIATSASLELDSAMRPRLRIGPYQTLEAIGHGGMGAVYRAERVDGAFDQEVALKLLHLDMETPQLQSRFVSERQILARLSHPNIARLLDGGVTDEGRPYFVMELVPGRAITRYCRDAEISIEATLRLFLDVINAVSYLHRNLVVHRDLKPSNIIVTLTGEVKLLDFGIAKLLDESSEAGGLTRTGELLMTPEYAAPEQLAGDPVTTATDVYALGTVLYELLTGNRPFDGSHRDSAVISSELPRTPSSMLRSQRRAPSPPSGSRSKYRPFRRSFRERRVDADLDEICLKALRPEPEERYASAEQFGQDIERFLEGLPVHARKGSLGYRLGKLGRRHWRGIAAVLAVLTLATAGFIRERGLRGEAERARTEAQRQTSRAVAVSGFLGELLSSVNPMKAQGREVTVADVLEQAAARIAENDELANQPAVEAELRRTIGVTYTSLGRYEDARGHLERAVELRGGFDADDPEALNAAADLGVLYQQLGRLNEAETILRRVLRIRVETLGEEDRASLASMNSLADLLWSRGRFDELEQLDRKTLEIRRRVLGEKHPDTLKSLNGLAAGLFNRGLYAEAAKLFDEALAISREILGEMHPHTLGLGSNLAAAQLELGHHAEAESVLRDNVEIRARVMGESHSETALSLHNLGIVLAEQARYDEAEEWLRRAIAARAKLPGSQRSLYFSQCHLADVLMGQGRHKEAEALYLATLSSQRETHGPDDRDSLRTALSLAELRRRQGDLLAAAALVEETLEPLRRVRGSEHSDTIGGMTTLARIRVDQRRFQEALGLSEQAVAAGIAALGEDHPAVLRAAFEQARALAALKRGREAEEIAERIHDTRAMILGPGHPETLAVRELLSLLHE